MKERLKTKGKKREESKRDKMETVKDGGGGRCGR